MYFVYVDFLYEFYVYLNILYVFYMYLPTPLHK